MTSKLLFDGIPHPSTDHPQVVQMFFPQVVDKLCKKSLLLTCNEPKPAGFGHCEPGFLPTMKSQLSQLP
jgi:hypothetical protein